MPLAVTEPVDERVTGVDVTDADSDAVAVCDAETDAVCVIEGETLGVIDGVGLQTALAATRRMAGYAGMGTHDAPAPSGDTSPPTPVAKTPVGGSDGEAPGGDSTHANETAELWVEW